MYIYISYHIIYIYIKNICLSAITPLFSIFSAQRLPSAPPIGTETTEQRQSGKGWPNIVAEMAGKPMGLPWAIYEWLAGRLTEWAFNHWTLPLNTYDPIEHCPIYHIMVFLFHWFYDEIWLKSWSTYFPYRSQSTEGWTYIEPTRFISNSDSSTHIECSQHAEVRNILSRLHKHQVGFIKKCS
jgi:hypothetical protein